MKTATRFSVSLIVLAVLFVSNLMGQIVFSRFDFNSTPYTTATIGPDGSAMDPDVANDGTAMYIDNNCGGTKGIDLTIPNTMSIFDQPSLGMSFRFKKHESRADFFVRGGTTFHQTGDVLMVEYSTSDGSGGSITYGPYDTGYVLPSDDDYHEYTFIYRAIDGVATVTVDGGNVWINDGPDNRDLYWTGAPDPLVGTVMDGNCPGEGILDFAYFFIPFEPLGPLFESFSASLEADEIQLDWVAGASASALPFVVERSKNGIDFAAIGQMNPETGSEAHAYTYTDATPGVGTNWYRISQANANGQPSSTSIMSVTLDGSNTSLHVWPNPASGDGMLNIALPAGVQHAEFVIYDMQGRIGGLGMEDIRDAGFRRVNIAGLAPGVYQLQCACDGERLTERLIVR